MTERGYMQDAPPVLFHYCSSQAFESIVRAGSIHLTSSKSTNDRLENRHASSCIAKFMPDLWPGDDAQMATQVSRYLEATWIPPRISCFSGKGDMLSQWRAYANDGRGFAIGIDPTALGLDLEEPETYKRPDSRRSYVIGNKPALTRVIYDDDVLRDALAVLKSRLDPEDPHHWFQAYLGLRSLAFCFKHHGFAEELEWRIIDAQEFAVKGERLRELKGADIQTKFGPDRMVEFRNYELRAAVVAVVRGPRNAVHPGRIRKFLKDNSIDCDVRTSEVPYRG